MRSNQLLFKSICSLFLVLLLLAPVHLLTAQEHFGDSKQKQQSSFIQILSYAQSICEESAKDIKTNWSLADNSHQEAHQLYNIVKAEVDSWIHLVQIRIKTNISLKVLDSQKKQKEQTHPIILAQNDFLQYYRNKQNFANASSTATLEVEQYNRSDFNKSIKKNIKKLNTEQKKFLIAELEGMRLSSWDEIDFKPKNEPSSSYVSKQKSPLDTTFEKDKKQSESTPKSKIKQRPKGTFFSYNPTKDKLQTVIDTAFEKDKKQSENSPKSKIKQQPKGTFFSSNPTKDTLIVRDLSTKMSPIKTIEQTLQANILLPKLLLEYYIKKFNKNEVSVSYEQLKIATSGNDDYQMTAYLADVLDFLEQKGVMSQADWTNIQKQEYNTENEELSSKNIDKYGIQSHQLIFDKRKKLETNVIEQIKDHLSKDQPLIGTVTMFNSEESTHKQPFIFSKRGDVSLQYLQTILLVGFDDEQRYFKFRTTKGPDWGEEGYGYLTYDYAKVYLRYLYDMPYQQNFEPKESITIVSAPAPSLSIQKKKTSPSPHSETTDTKGQPLVGGCKED